MNLQNSDEMLFVRRLLDLCGTAKKRSSPRYTAFLNEHEQALCKEILTREGGIEYAFFGGYEGAVRKILAIYPDYSDPDELCYPLVALTARHAKGEKLSHRDVLGSLMGLGLSRSSIGDILPDNGECRFLALETVADTLKGEFSKIGRVGVRCERAKPEDLGSVQEFETFSGTVSSMRLDSVVKLMTNLAREKSAGLVKAGLVQKNHTVTENISAAVMQGDIITVRGHGKYIIDSIGEKTRKGRLPVLARKYK